jgi:N utilization substance protein B
MGYRRLSRELALQALFFLDMNSSGDVQADVAAFCLENEVELTPTVQPFFMELVQGVMSTLDKIDPMLETYSKNWKVSRMPVVDRNIMRIAAFELLERPDIPPSVTINEAVDIAKKFSTRESGPFVNGILDRIREAIGR